MSDGECHKNRCYRRFSQNDTHCQSCGAPKWRWRCGDQMPTMRRLIEIIAATERGRHEAMQ